MRKGALNNEKTIKKDNSMHYGWSCRNKLWKTNR